MSTGAEQLLLPAPVVFRHGLIRLDAEPDDFFDDLPPLGVARVMPELLQLSKQLFVDECIELRPAFSGTRRCHEDIAITFGITPVSFPNRSGVSHR